MASDRSAAEAAMMIGMGSDMSVDKIRPFRLSTVHEQVLSRMAFEKASGLRKDQFVTNPWGFPIIPVPQLGGRNEGGGLHLSPGNVNGTWIGHPIYWIDPDLTKPTEAEKTNSSAWAVRMFYLIMGLGLWEETPYGLLWVDAPTFFGVEVDDAEIIEFREGRRTTLDRVKFTADDLIVTYESIETQSRDAVEICLDMEREQWVRFRNEQVQAYADSRDILLAPDSGRWSAIQSDLSTLRREMTNRIINGEPRADLSEPYYEVGNQLSKYLASIDRLSVILNAVVMRQTSNDVATFARIVSVMNEYNSAVESGGSIDLINENIDRMFKLGPSSSDEDFAKLETLAEVLYTEAIQRLDLATQNFLRGERGRAPFLSIQEMEMSRMTEDEEFLLDPLEIKSREEQLALPDLGR